MVCCFQKRLLNRRSKHRRNHQTLLRHCYQSTLPERQKAPGECCRGLLRARLSKNRRLLEILGSSPCILQWHESLFITRLIFNYAVHAYTHITQMFFISFFSSWKVESGQIRKTSVHDWHGTAGGQGLPRQKIQQLKGNTKTNRKEWGLNL